MSLLGEGGCYVFSAGTGGFMGTRKLQIPSFREESALGDYTVSQHAGTVKTFTSVVVVRWGRVRGFTFRAGDRLVLSDSCTDRELLLLRPRGYGWPMLGRREGGELKAEPGGVRAAPRRWRVAAGVVAVERALARSVMDRGDWHVAVVARGETTAAQLREARLVGGRLPHRLVDEVCHRAARFVDEGMGLVSVGVGRSPAEARDVAEGCPPGRMRMPPAGASAALDVAAQMGDVVEGPWQIDSPSVAGSYCTTPPAQDQTRYDRPAMLGGSESASVEQVPLFHQTRRSRAS